MTDSTLSGIRSIDVGTDAARARITARYRAESRFRFYGLAAIGVTALFLAVVLTDIVVKGYPAFTQNVLVMNITVDPAEIDPKGSRNPDDIRAGDFQALVRDWLRTEFPDAKDRVQRRQLDGLLSSGASDYLRNRVVADPSLIGQDNHRSGADVVGRRPLLQGYRDPHCQDARPRDGHAQRDNR